MYENDAVQDWTNGTWIDEHKTLYILRQGFIFVHGLMIESVLIT